MNYLTSNLNSSHNRFGANSSVPNSPIATTLEFPGVHYISATKSFSLQHIHTNKWSAYLAKFGSPEVRF